MRPSLQTTFLALAILLIALSLPGCSGGSPSAEAPAVNVKLIAINDFHGRLKVDPNDRGAFVPVQDKDSKSGVTKIYAGGAAYLATLVKQLRASTEHSMVVAAGDIIGASQPIAGLTSEEAAIDVMNQIGLEVSAVGNHEFDKGKAELLRMQNGGCKPGVKPEQIGKVTCINNSQSAPDGKFGGAKFKYLAANVTDSVTKKPLMDPTYTKKFGAATVGFIGLTLQATSSVTGGANDLTFADEASVINARALELRKNGADAVVVLIHQGGQTMASYIDDQSCPGMSGLLQPIVAKLQGVDVVVSGHTHQEYICQDQATGILYTSAGFYGRMVTDINLKIVPGKGVTEKTAKTIPVANNINNGKPLPGGLKELTPDTATQAIIDVYDKATAGTLQEVRGYTTGLISNCNRTQSIESPLGDVLADAFLDSYLSSNQTELGVIAFTNAGGVRASIPYLNAGAVTYNALYTVAPFGNNLVYKDLTGKQLKRLLEQQWEATNCSEQKLPETSICGRLLQPSGTLRYTWDWALGQGKPNGTGALLVSVEVFNKKLNAWEPVMDDAKYRVISNEFLADGGDKFTVFSQQKDKQDFGKNDLEALVDYFEKTKASGQNTPLPAPKPRATCVNCPPLSETEKALCQK